MPVDVNLSPQAAEDIASIRRRLNQPGAKTLLVQRLTRAIRGLTNNAGTHAPDPDRAGSLRLSIIGGYVVPYQYIKSLSGEFVIVDRVFAPAVS
jgi:plasmid stabilization system protein ParE